MNQPDQEEELAGGGMTRVSRLGSVVYRSRGPGSDRVEELLGLLEQAGFRYAPRFRGLAPDGRQMLDYLAGEVGSYPLSAAVRSDPALRSAARVLRALHDATAEWAANLVGGWLLPDVAPPEVVCHGDFAPYNCVFDGERMVGLIDFDAAHTGPRLRDVAYAVYRFAPLTAPDSAVAAGTLDEQLARTRDFCDAYGLADRTGLIPAVRARLADLVAFLRAEAAAGNAAFATHLAAGHDLSYLADAEYLRQNEAEITAALGR